MVVTGHANSSCLENHLEIAYKVVAEDASTRAVIYRYKKNEKENYSILLGKRFYIFEADSDYGIHLKYVNSDWINFIAKYGTYDANYLVNTKNNEIVSFPDGEFFSDNNGEFYVFGIKGYGTNPEGKDYFGAFWYNAKVNESGKIIELLDYEGEDAFCLDYEILAQQIKKREQIWNALISQGKEKWCVFR